ncbi:MAG TPA: cation:proton antiporter, partial [Steroidobacteraceae bacterium]|nr:cation:proton antiporter [Steroidobacteraceae bacterium]
AALFFVAVGMLFEPLVLVQHPLQVLEVFAIIVLGKSLAALALVRLLRRPLRTALTVAAALAQIGEFSFILAVMGVSMKLLPPQGQSYIVAGAILSIVVNPLVFRLLARRST